MIQTMFSIIIFAVLLPANLFAQSLVYDNEAGGVSDLSSFALSRPSSFITDDFVLETSHRILAVEWTGVYLFGDEPSSDDFLIAIFDAAPSGPGSLISTFSVGDEVNRIDSGFDFLSRDIYDYSASIDFTAIGGETYWVCLLYTSPSPRDKRQSRMPSSA